MVSVLILAVLVAGPLLSDSAVPGAPFYTADSIVNTATGEAGSFAPNAFITMYGQNLSFVTRAINSSDIAANTLPTALTGTGVRVLINALPAYLWYVSPAQVTLLVPSFWTAGPATIQLEVNGIVGPEVQIMLNAAAPGLFLNPNGSVGARHLDYSPVTTDSPASDGELILLYAGGLGPVNPAVPSGQIPQVAAQLTEDKQLSPMAGWRACRPFTDRIRRGGAGLGRSLRDQSSTTAGCGTQPEIRISTADTISPGQRYVVLQ